jgi:3-hydroxyacyl-CoA dehydrogenase / enoyl-CoA hydratase / 3-hydroxybutyryl-CoA epimerase
VRLIAEGADPILVENGGVLLGMPMGPLTLADEVGIDVLHHVAHLFREREHGEWADDKYGAGNALIDRLYLGQNYGRKAGHGFYAYPSGEAKRFEFALPRSAVQPTIEEVKERLLYAQVLEAMRCWVDGVIEDPREGDLGAHWGWGFPSYLGGPFALVDTLGATEFLRRCEALKSRFGMRFEAPAKLAQSVASGERFHAVAD